MVAIGVTAASDRQILGVDVGSSEDRSFWTAFLRSVMKRGLAGVRLVISDAHEGLKQAIKTVLGGTAWQRCRVHFMRNLLAVVPHSLREPVAAIVRTIFAQPDHASALGQLQKVADGLRKRLPAAAALLEEAAGAQAPRRVDDDRLQAHHEAGECPLHKLSRRALLGWSVKLRTSSVSAAMFARADAWVGEKT